MSPGAQQSHCATGYMSLLVSSKGVLYRKSKKGPVFQLVHVYVAAKKLKKAKIHCMIGIITGTAFRLKFSRGERTMLILVIQLKNAVVPNAVAPNPVAPCCQNIVAMLLCG